MSCGIPSEIDHLKVSGRGAEANRPPVVVRLVRPEEPSRWDELMVAHHYLGFLILPGERRPNLAFQVLGANARPLSQNWPAVSGIRS
ncbi:MAG: hypothetical protein ACYDC5_07785 [Candidatus Dormibacteria bacterium]